jgi:lipopolysaccharide transport system ATP-binding protein
MPPAIKVENLGKSYRIGHESQRGGYRTLRESLVNVPAALMQRMRNARYGGGSEEFWALKGVDLEVQPGEIVGVIGRNGAGKSTLLKILSRITKPTTGAIELRGRVGSLLEVGTGFHPELTGRENIFLNGSILGMPRREISRRFDEIVDFSEVERFLDTPVKRYSSGMYVRLAFAVAAHLNPEILIIDEVLSVGDYDFQKKCLGKIDDLARGGTGRTILFVSHNLGMVRSLCSRCLYLKAGRGVAQGATETIIDLYEQNQAGDGQNGLFQQPSDDRYVLQVLEAELLNEHGHRQTTAIDQFSPLSLRLRYEVRKPLVGCNLCVWLNYRGTRLFATFDTDEDSMLLGKRKPGQYETVVPVPTGMLKSGTYAVGLASGIINQSSRPDHQLFDSLFTFEIRETFDTSLKGYAPQRPGIIAAPLGWNTQHLGMAMSSSLEGSVPCSDTA